MTLSEFNDLDTISAKEILEQCCAAPEWIAKMEQSRPFLDLDQLLNTADRQWQTMDERNLLAAFKAHPKIGNIESLSQKYANTKDTASSEQSGVDLNATECLQILATRNEDYYQKFGFIFIVFATGKSAGDMCTLINSRYLNTRQQEVIYAAQEQAKITALRLKKLVTEG